MAARLEDVVGAVADELYTVDPNDFVAARTDLVRRLRAAKQRDVAAQVAKLRRPSPAAWAVNQLVRTQRSDVEDLVRLGDELREAQDRALGGAGGDELRHAARARRDAVAALTASAARLLATRGGGVDAHLPGVTATLEAASLDAGVGATVLEGRLSTDLEPPSGFGELPFRLTAPETPAPKAEEPAPEPRRHETEAAEHAVADARSKAEERAAAARAAATRAGDRRRAVEQTEADVDRLRTQLAEAEDRLAVARDEAGQAEQEALDADAAAVRAAEELDEAQRRLRDVRA